jgi:alpha,alpha-trehalase
MKRIILSIALILAMCNMTLTSFAASTENRSDFKNSESLRRIHKRLADGFKLLRQQVVKSPDGFIKYPYLIPAGFYSQLWDWDAFFMANHFISKGEPEYMKNWVLTFSQGIDKDGYVAGCMTSKGPRQAYSGKFAMKPFLSQGAYQYSKATGDWEWIRPIYNDLERVLDYRRSTQLDSISGLYFWEIAMQSGADNNPALNYFKDDSRSFISVDASAFQYGELLAQAAIAEKLGMKADATRLRKEALGIKTALNEICWNEDDGCYYNVDRDSREQYRRVGYSTFVPLFYRMAPEDRGRRMISRYMLDEKHMKAPHGFRSLSASDVDYNNKNIIVPFSNWQGPIWGITSYIYSVGLHNYGFDEDVAWMAEKVGALMAKDLDEYGTMHETYHAETGEPLAPSNFKYRNPDGSIQGFVSWNLCMENILEGLLQGKWMLLDIDDM